MFLRFRIFQRFSFFSLKLQFSLWARIEPPPHYVLFEEQLDKRLPNGKQKLYAGSLRSGSPAGGAVVSYTTKQTSATVCIIIPYRFLCRCTLNDSGSYCFFSAIFSFSQQFRLFNLLGVRPLNNTSVLPSLIEDKREKKFTGFELK